MFTIIISLKEIPGKIMFKYSHWKTNSKNKGFEGEGLWIWWRQTDLNLAWCCLCTCTILKCDSFGSLSFGNLNLLPFSTSSAFTFAAVFLPIFSQIIWKYMRLYKQQWLWSMSSQVSYNYCCSPFKVEINARVWVSFFFWRGGGSCLLVGFFCLFVCVSYQSASWKKHMTGGLLGTLLRANELYKEGLIITATALKWT